MAKLKKDNPEPASNPYEFILPLDQYQLRTMWDEYTDGKQIKNFRGKNGNLVPAYLVYFNKEKVMSYDAELGQFNSYMPDGLAEGDYEYKYEQAKRHWRQFEEYAHKREYAIKQDTNAPLLDTSVVEPEVKLMDFWQG